MTDKGFGPSAGPDCPTVLAAPSSANGYNVTEGDSPWLLGRSDQALIDALVPGFADAVGETGMIDEQTLALAHRHASRRRSRPHRHTRPPHLIPTP